MLLAWLDDVTVSCYVSHTSDNNDLRRVIIIFIIIIITIMIRPPIPEVTIHICTSYTEPVWCVIYILFIYTYLLYDVY